MLNFLRNTPTEDSPSYKRVAEKQKLEESFRIEFSGDVFLSVKATDREITELTLYYNKKQWGSSCPPRESVNLLAIGLKRLDHVLLALQTELSDYILPEE